MVDRRVEKGVKRGKPFEIEVDGETLVAYEGETVAAVLVAAGRRTSVGPRRRNIRAGCIAASVFATSA